MDTQPYTRLVYSPTSQGTTATSPHINASLPDGSWHSASQPSQDNPSPPVHSSQMYPAQNRQSDHLDYASLPTEFVSPNQTGPFNPSNHPQQIPLHQDIPPGIVQADPAISPGRVLTRRQRALLQQGDRRPSDHSSMSVEAMDTHSSHSVFFMPSEASSPHTPPHAERSELYSSPTENHSLINGSPTVSLPHHSTTISASGSPTSTYSPYGATTTHSRSTSASNSNPRSASPALSVASALTSVSSASAPMSQALTPYPLPSIGQTSPVNARKKQHKQRLFNVDRKAICDFHMMYPNAKQEEIASRYNVERSTISKILKHKTKWLSVPPHDSLRVAKHRPSKFPEIEARLLKWLIETKRNNTVLSDALIRQKAKEAAQILNIPDEKFKASSGWVENFKHRHGIRGGVWHGDGRNGQLARTFGGVYPIDVTLQTYTPAVMNSYSGSSNTCIDIEKERRGNYTLDPSVSVQPAWHCSPDQSLPPNVLLPPVNSMDRSRFPQTHQTPHTTFVQHPHHPEAIIHYNHTHNHEAHHESPSTYDVLQIHSAAPRLQLRPDETPTITEAEEACNIVIKYIDMVNPTLIEPQEREALTIIRQALFQTGSGLPFDRRTVR